MQYAQQEVAAAAATAVGTAAAATSTAGMAATNTAAAPTKKPPQTHQDFVFCSDFACFLAAAIGWLGVGSGVVWVPPLT